MKKISHELINGKQCCRKLSVSDSLNFIRAKVILAKDSVIDRDNKQISTYSVIVGKQDTTIINQSKTIKSLESSEKIWFTTTLSLGVLLIVSLFTR